MIWGCFSWSGLGTASQQSSWMYWINRLSHQWIFSFPDGSGIFQDTKIHSPLLSLLSSSCERVEHEDTWVSGSMRSHFHTWIGHHRVLTLTPLKVFGVKGKDWRNQGPRSNFDIGECAHQILFLYHYSVHLISTLLLFRGTISRSSQ